MHSLSTILFLLERKEERNMLDIKFVRENPEKVKENISIPVGSFTGIKFWQGKDRKLN